MLACFTSLDIPLDGFSNAWSIQILENHCLRLIQSWMKEIRVVSFYYIFLEFIWNDYFILVRYKLYSIPASAKKKFFDMLRI